jgi:hypothetical protein
LPSLDAAEVGPVVLKLSTHSHSKSALLRAQRAGRSLIVESSDHSSVQPIVGVDLCKLGTQLLVSLVGSLCEARAWMHVASALHRVEH